MGGPDAERQVLPVLMFVPTSRQFTKTPQSRKITYVENKTFEGFMGIRLDWEVESEQRDIHKATEDPAAVMARRLARVRLLFIVLVVVVFLAGITTLLSLRLSENDSRVESFLRDTVEAEVASLRIGDKNSFMAAQRSATDDWLQQQSAYFDLYQQLKSGRDVTLPGTVRNLTIDHLRARVSVEEIIDGIPYQQLWFYWRYEDGWRHVAPDYTFWGDMLEYQGRDVSVLHREVDEQLARDLGVNVERWIRTTCDAALQCGDFPHIRVHISPVGFAEVQWDAGNQWQLNVPSPYVVRARSDKPFSGDLQIAVADLVARRLVEESSATKDSPIYPHDVYYLRPAVVSWLVGSFVELNTNAHLITSLDGNYGSDYVGKLLKGLTPQSSVAVFGDILGVPVAEANLDWRDFLTWRLRLEIELRSRGGEADYLSLFDPAFADTARQRYAAPVDPTITVDTGVVRHVERSLGIDGALQLLATVRYGSEKEGNVRDEQILFRYIGDTWKRAS
jgi:hypothetical protein